MPFTTTTVGFATVIWSSMTGQLKIITMPYSSTQRMEAHTSIEDMPSEKLVNPPTSARTHGSCLTVRLVTGRFKGCHAARQDGYDTVQMPRSMSGYMYEVNNGNCKAPFATCSHFFSRSCVRLVSPRHTAKSDHRLPWRVSEQLAASLGIWVRS